MYKRAVSLIRRLAPTARRSSGNPGLVAIAAHRLDRANSAVREACRALEVARQTALAGAPEAIVDLHLRLSQANAALAEARAGLAMARIATAPIATNSREMSAG
ncbi:hypothetical protein [Methylobrevis pamukkalensis]|uniref:Uncharacterized protein n=1 Tax=Methylobrevis pamukkalensis TaxID=1439726 RepID=A0A1E3GXC3_9HYPH|nr:hypothetical protein [Methylobrevis pamukkalensis]ODN68708.1 hypothetical protein A6302_03991 [Methylobrevis pamukkalensis]